MTASGVRDEPPRPSAAAFGFWGTLLGGLAGVQAAFGGGLLPVLVQAVAGAAIAGIGLAIFVAGRSRPAGVRRIPELSLASALAGVSGAAIVCGASVGSWLIIGGVLGLSLATAGLVRERRAQRRERA